MSDPLPPLPPALDRLFADERDAPAGSDEERRAIGMRIAATVGLASLGGSAAAATSGSAGATASTAAGIAGKIVALVLAVGVIGGGTALVLGRHGHDAPAPRPQPSAALTGTATVPVAQPHPELPSPAVETAMPPPPASPAISDSASPPREAPRHETVARRAPPAEDQPALLAQAWSALGRDDAAAVLALVERDAAAHPDGPLDEERDALRIEALRRLGHLDEARRAARAFLTRYPSSLQRALVKRALEEAP